MRKFIGNSIKISIRFKDSIDTSSVVTVYDCKVISLKQAFENINFTPPPISHNSILALPTTSTSFPRYMNISEDFIPGTPIIRISTDLPAKFDLLSDNDMFSINAKTGVLTLRKMLLWKILVFYFIKYIIFCYII